MPKVSIIIPVYNVEKYLKKCLDSIRKQSFKDFEVICVNDCSVDNSLKLLNIYASKDSRIKVIDLDKNGGVSHARNIALDEAKGEYIAFVDPDDWIETSILKKSIEILDNIKVDAVWYNTYTVYENNKTLKYEKKDKQDTYKEDLLAITSSTISKVTGCVWSYIYRKSLIDEMNLRFPENLIVEDDEFTFKYFVKNKLVYRLNTPLYYYRKTREGSYTQSQREKIITNAFKICERIYDWLIETNNFQEYKIPLLGLIAQRMETLNKPEYIDLYQVPLDLLDKIGYPQNFEDLNKSNPLFNFKNG